MLIYNANGPSGYRIANSLRFRSSASAYLNRTPSVAGNRQTWTWSGWVKRGALSAQGALFSAGTSTATFDQIVFNSSDNALTAVIYASNAVVGQLNTTQVFRDLSAWYHIVVVWDSTNATSSNRLRLYINGSQVTTFITNTQPPQNAVSTINSAVLHTHGDLYYGSHLNYFDGYLADINFIDGQALTPSSFGQISTVTGVWQPIAYSGTYGTNGFKLNFSNGTSTTTLGYDSSGNSNNWTTNNVSLTAGVTYDWMLDSPTPLAGTSYGVGNYATLNPLGKSTYANISNGNLNISWSDNASANFAANSATITLPSSGKWYFELSNAAADGNNGIGVGICDATKIANGGNTTPTTYYLYRSDANNSFIGYQSNAGSGSTGSTFLGGAICGIAVDLDNGKFWAAINNTWQGGGNPATGTSPGYSGISNATTWVPFIGGWEWTGTVCSASINFGQRPFAFSPPSGFKSLCTYNLPAASIVNGASYMAATTYTGNGSTQSIVNSGAFQPDLVWLKNRTSANNNWLMNSVAGATNGLISNATTAEQSVSPDFAGFSTNGFNLNSASNNFNGSAQSYVAWQWKANGTAVSNTAGSITSQVSANTTAGFSVVTYTGNGNVSATVGHGLGVAPAMVIQKSRSDGSYSWRVYHQSLSAGNMILLNSTSAALAINSDGGISSVGSSTFGFSGGTPAVNASGTTYVAYCFAAIAGYSAFGSYTGNGSTDGPFVYTNFRPRWIMIKRTDTTSNWVIVDSSRNVYNPQDLNLYPNLSAAEDDYTSTYPFDMLSNGFKFRANYGNVNASGGTYIYAAFAESPFTNSLAR